MARKKGGEGQDGGSHGPVEEPSNVVRVDFGARRARAVPAEQPLSPQVVEPPAVVALDPLGASKLKAFTGMIEKGVVMLVLDPRVSGVRVPPQFAAGRELRLNFSLRFGIADFAYDASGVQASLSFGGKDFFCVVPWPAVHAMHSQVTGETATFQPPVP